MLSLDPVGNQFLQLFQAMMESDLSFVTHDVQIRRFLPGISGNVLVDFEMLLSRSFPPSAMQVEENIKKGVQKIKKPTSTQGEYLLDDTKILVSGMSLKSMAVTGQCEAYYLFVLIVTANSYCL